MLAGADKQKAQRKAQRIKPLRSNQTCFRPVISCVRGIRHHDGNQLQVKLNLPAYPMLRLNNTSYVHIARIGHIASIHLDTKQ